MKYIIYYNNNFVEAMDKINPTFIHLIDLGIIRSIVDIENKKVWSLNQEGITKDEDICIVSGL